MEYMLPAPLTDITEEPEDVSEITSRRGSTTPLEQEGMELPSIENIQKADMFQLVEWSGNFAEIREDSNLSEIDDIRQRLILLKRKQMGCSYKKECDHFFTAVHSETKTKVDALRDLFCSVKAIFSKIPTESLSEILQKEGHLTQPLLTDELTTRAALLRERNSLVIVAGETNGGKSSFLNLLLGVDILPTDVLHCTYSICKIVYAESYSVETLDYKGQVEKYTCYTLEDAQRLLKSKAVVEGVTERTLGSVIKEVTLRMPAEILKSGVTLVDTPGIGEDEHMDDITMSYVKSTHASAFIYIIKSDNAGGVQDDRLLSFLRAIKERYQTDKMREYFDPKAAMFVCHRWDNIDDDQKEKVKRHALQKLEDVWPGFDPSQTYFFSTKSTLKHLPVDPEYITDSYYELLKGLKGLFNRAGQNAIKYQYLWLKYILQPASKNLKAMITHCIHSNEELESYFQNVALKQERLMVASKEKSVHLHEFLEDEITRINKHIGHILEFDDVTKVDGYAELINEAQQVEYLTSAQNRKNLDEMVVRNLLKYVDRVINESGRVASAETDLLRAIQDHLGLFKSQIKQIKDELVNGNRQTSLSRSRNSYMEHHDLSASMISLASISSDNSSVSEFNEISVDPAKMEQKIKSMLTKRKQSGVRHKSSLDGKQAVRQNLLSMIKNKIKFHGRIEPKRYVDERIRKWATKMRQDPEMIKQLSDGYTEWMQKCVKHGTSSIPKFIEVNKTLMEEIREHRETFQKDKEMLKNVMEELEPSRDLIKGFGSLYMEDINADAVDFSDTHSVHFPSDISVSVKPNDDSGFQGLWGRMQLATITADNEKKRVLIKTYTYDMDDRMFFSEIASLRCLDAPNIAQFFGMTRIKTCEQGGATFGKAKPQSISDQFTQKISAFIFNGDLISARVYTTSKIIRLNAFIPDFVHSLLSALEYIHNEKLVHMELNLDTVMVERSTGTVKLCQMCKPREARFPRDTSLVKTGSCIYLSPNVLSGNVYEQTDDIYAFGLLLWELLYPLFPPFKEQKSWILKDYIAKCHPKNMLSDTLIYDLQPSEPVCNVLRNTILLERGTICMSIPSIRSCLSQINMDPALTLLPRGGRFAPIHRNDYKRQNPRTDQSAPQRPPRKNDQRRRQSTTTMPTSASLDDGSAQDTTPPPTANRGRRQSAPEIHANLTLPGKKGKSQKRSVFDFFRKRNERRNSTTEVSQTLGVTPVEEGTNVVLKSVSLPNGSAPSKATPSKLRRFSLQEITLTVPRIRSNNSDNDNLDVPKLFSRTECLTLATPLARTMPRSSRNTSHPDHFAEAFHGRLMPAESLPCLVPSIEKQRNSFFHEDDKVSESWHSPTMKRKPGPTNRESLTSRIGASMPARRSGLQNQNIQPQYAGQKHFEKIHEELAVSTKSNKSVMDNIANGSSKRSAHITNEPVANGACRRPTHITNEPVANGVCRRPPLITYPSCEDDTKPLSQETYADFSSSNTGYQAFSGSIILKSSLKGSRSTERINSLFSDSARLGPDSLENSLRGSHRRSVSFDDNQQSSFKPHHRSSIIAYSESSSEESLSDSQSHFRRTSDEASPDDSTNNFYGFDETTEPNISKFIHNQQFKNFDRFQESTESNLSTLMPAQSDHGDSQMATLTVVGTSFDAVALGDSVRSFLSFEETSAEADLGLTDLDQPLQSDDASIPSPFPIPKSLNSFQFDFLNSDE
ncbi:uncharacterized protein LOC131953293 isoform X2 [Physella acuta]|uniref:uncharacterized protein LOC131953293 isoform X2 n=1 Tax=Physella acuta TaxID=109671 RepID=UPI0027DCE4B3|nr:uncharacterized protein LOC131953293 isoform X2 [Physella acuta]